MDNSGLDLAQNKGKQRVCITKMTKYAVTNLNTLFWTGFTITHNKLTHTKAQLVKSDKLFAEMDSY